MKPKNNRRGDAAASLRYDRCQTPFYALDPLLPYLNRGWRIWEPAAGEGNIAARLRLDGYTVTASDLLTGQNFFDYSPPGWDCLVTNPPYSIKYDWLGRCYQLGKPFALLMPLETMGAAKGQILLAEYGVEVILLNRRVNFKMPGRGYTGGGAQFPTAWFTWGLGIGRQLSYGAINYYPDEQLSLFAMQC